MYADRITDSMQLAIDETNRRRDKQIAYNTERGVNPEPLRKKISDITELLAREDADTEQLLASTSTRRTGSQVPLLNKALNPASLPQAELAELIGQLTEQMHAAALELQFELAARIRDEVADLKRELRNMQEAGV